MYFGLLFDEVKIKADLVYHKHSGELIGFVNLNNTCNELLELEKSFGENESIAKYLLVLMVRGITTNIRYPLAAFATLGITSDFLYPIVWEAISHLEIFVGIHILFICCDGATPNRKFFKLHGQGNELVHFTENPYNSEAFIYFISDPPHLIKTTRNCFSNSYSHFKSRKLWNLQDISWMDIVSLFENYCELNCFSPCPKLTRAHIDLTLFSRMNVSLAAQILSNTVSCALQNCIGGRVSELSIFLIL